MTNDHEGLAQTLWQAEIAEVRIEDRLCHHVSELIDHIGWDQYDESLEIYFDPTTPADFQITEQQAAIIWQMGFRCAWANFCDGTEQTLTRNQTYSRRPVTSDRWSKERFDDRCLRVARMVELARLPLVQQIAQLSESKTQPHV